MFGGVGFAERLDVLHGVALGFVGGDGVEHGLGVGGADGGVGRETFGVADGGEPSDRAAPVVPDEVSALDVEGVEQADDVAGEFVDRVVLDALGARGGRVSAQVRGDDAVAGVGELRCDETPLGVRLGEAVQQHHRRAVIGAGHGDVERQVVDGDGAGMAPGGGGLTRSAHGSTLLVGWWLSSACGRRGRARSPSA